jgi:hypothetical protein
MEASCTRDCLSRWDAVTDDGAVLWSNRSDRGGDCAGGDGWELPLRVQVTSGDGDGGGS